MPNFVSPKKSKPMSPEQKERMRKTRKLMEKIRKGMNDSAKKATVIESVIGKKKAEQKKAEQMREEKKKQAIPRIEALMKEVERIKKEVGMT